MSDFELQRRLREMNAPREPGHDLWNAIERRISDVAIAPRRTRRLGWPIAAAAGVVLALAGAALLVGLQPAPTAAIATATPDRAGERGVDRLSRAPGGDPRLLGAAVVLDSAHAELEQALEERPDAVFLVSLLNRTNARRMKLDHYGANAG